MITLIMVIGQGSAGKSTFGQKIIQYLNNSVLIRFDDFNKIYHNEKISLELYINKIQEEINKNREYIICDFSQDSISCREYILDRLQYPNEIKFEAIVLRPGYENIFNWKKKRFEDSNIEYNEKDLQILIKNVYNGIQIPTIDEFKKYNFLDTLIIIYDNYKNEILDIIT